MSSTAGSTPWLFEAGRTNKNLDLTLFLLNRHPETGEVEQSFQHRIRQGGIVVIDDWARYEEWRPSSATTSSR